MPRTPLLSALALLAATTCAAADPPRPHIIVILADDQGWGDMAYNGHPHLITPHFDAMAEQAIRFDHAYAAAPVCSPTRASVLTGRTPNRSSTLLWGHHLRPQEHTIAHALHRAGYATAHFGKWHLGTVYPNCPTNPGSAGFSTWASTPNFYENDPIFSIQGQATQLVGESSILLADLLKPLLEEQLASATPLFAFLCFGSPHHPHVAAREFLDLYPDHPRPVAHFYGEISGMDAALGQVRQLLRKLDVHRDTILWYISDNGALPDLGAPGGRGHKGQIYEGGLRVPALLEWPARFPEPFVSKLPTSTSDIYPSLLAALQITPPDGRPLDGIDIFPLLDARSDDRPSPLGFWSFEPASGIPVRADQIMKNLLADQQAGRPLPDELILSDAATIARQYPADHLYGHSAWIDWPYKLHRIQALTQVDAPAAAPRLELYHLADDPAERDNLAVAQPDRTAALQSKLEAWLSTVILSLNGEDYP